MCPVGRCGIGTSARQNVSTSEQVWQLIMSTSSRFMSSSMVRYLAKALAPCAVVCSSNKAVYNSIAYFRCQNWLMPHL